MYLGALHHFEMLTNKYLGVSTTRETANSWPLVVTSSLLVVSVMIKSVTIPWIGNSLFLLRLKLLFISV